MFAAQSTSRPVPFRALLISLASLAVPVVWALVAPEWAGEEAGMLLWLTALVPAFLFTYYRGWQGASLALAAGMAVLSSTQVFLLVAGLSTPDWSLVLVVVLIYMAVSFGIGALAEILHRERRAAEEMALSDPLTGLPNRRHAGIFLEAAFASAERGSALSAVLFDVDHFKEFNDQHGHAAGDQVLKTLGEVLTEQTRDMDLTARWGGEEFLSVLQSAGEEGAVIFAERVRKALAEAPNRWGPVTVSAGIAAHADGMESPELLVAAADRALYRAKEEGRDRICRARPEPTRVTGRDEVEPDTTAGEEKEKRLPASRRGTETVLLVEDDGDARRAVARTLQFHGYDVVQAASGEEALETLDGRRGGVDLVVTDIIMPGMSGFTLVARLMKRDPGLPVLYMSGYAHDDVSWEGVPGSRNEFLKKPMSVEELGTRVRMLLDG